MLELGLPKAEVVRSRGADASSTWFDLLKQQLLGRVEAQRDLAGCSSSCPWIGKDRAGM